ncbi:MAG: hypothetical protein ACREXY_07545 [Gammaproteobacteria bacterium]
MDRIETRKIWTTAALIGYLDFPHVAQAFVIERETIEKKTRTAAASAPATAPKTSPPRQTFLNQRAVAVGQADRTGHR